MALMIACTYLDCNHVSVVALTSGLEHLAFLDGTDAIQRIQYDTIQA